MDEIEELGTRAAHWCMYWRDSGEHNYQQHWKRGQVCRGVRCRAAPTCRQEEGEIVTEDSISVNIDRSQIKVGDRAVAVALG